MARRATGTRTLGELAPVVRSKNAKPFRLTFDVIFDDPAVYRRVKAARVLTRERIAALYGVAPGEVLSVHEFDAGLAIKFTLRRPIPQGAPGDGDVYGCQQHAPLLDLEVPWD
jgi:hypothetical protein